jgi:hypothetical protein
MKMNEAEPVGERNPEDPEPADRDAGPNWPFGAAERNKNRLGQTVTDIT